MTKVSFDYDSTLSESWVQTIAGILVPVCEVWIVTARSPGLSHNQDLYKTAKKLNIPEERIVFTDGAFKWSVLTHHGINLHFDDMEDEVLMINQKSNCKGVLVGLSDLNNLWYLFNDKLSSDEA